jgi:hypothetical protein
VWLSTAGGALTLGGTVDGSVANSQSLRLDAGANGTVTLAGMLGESLPLNILQVDAGQGIRINTAKITTSNAQTYNNAIRLGSDALLVSLNNTVSYTSIDDGNAVFNAGIYSANAMSLANVDIAGDFQVKTLTGGVTQQSGTRLLIGGTTRFIADTGTQQTALLNSLNNRFSGEVTFTQVNQGSWNDVTVSTQAPLTLAALQSGGSVRLQTQGASLTTRSITASANLNIDTGGGGASLGRRPKVDSPTSGAKAST